MAPVVAAAATAVVATAVAAAAPASAGAAAWRKELGCCVNRRGSQAFESTCKRSNVLHRERPTEAGQRQPNGRHKHDKTKKQQCNEL